MRRVEILVGVIGLGIALAVPGCPDDLSAIRVALQEKYIVTATTPGKTRILTTGSLLVLKKSHLMAVDAESKIVYQNSYRNGRITQKGLGNMLSKMKKFPGMGDTASAAEREFVSGDKMWVTGIEMREKEVVFTLFSDAYPGTRFGADLSFPLERGSNPTAREVMADVAEVFDVQPPNSEGSQQTQQQPLQQLSQPANLQAAAMQRSEAPPPPIAPPPPPPADPKEIKLGQTPQQVVGSFGQPDRVIKLTSKQIYLYKDMKVTFVGGKVTAVE